jgi:hypothetical protein
MIIIYLSFYFSGHLCAGSLQINDDKITYWNDGNYITEAIIKSDKAGYDRIIKTESGRIIVIGYRYVQYFIDNKIMRQEIKRDMIWKKKL